MARAAANSAAAAARTATAIRAVTTGRESTPRASGGVYDDLGSGSELAGAARDHREAIGAEQRGEDVGGLRSGRRRRRVRIDPHAHALVAIGMALDGYGEPGVAQLRRRVGALQRG